MAAKKATLNARKFKRQLKKLNRYVYGRFARQVLEDFKDETPRDSGYAKRHTKKRVSKGRYIAIYATDKYKGYAPVLDEGLFPNPPKKGTGKTKGGYSTQAPKGMSEPTLDKAEKRFNRFVRNL